MINPTFYVVIIAFCAALVVAGVDMIIIFSDKMNEVYKNIKFGLLVLIACIGFYIAEPTLLLFLKLSLFTMAYWIFFDMIMSWSLTGTLHHIGTTSFIDRWATKIFKPIHYYFAIRILIGFGFWFWIEYYLTL